ncbi:glycosyltransferase family 2 protein [Rudanella lutea]|uniref:glycosyltransferase family 2 protein n=1 Tax=Rudanella lutea TaxID=451374 RepID=UPI000379D0CE|nr:glycosyltransferase family 2 protein [Rudanella lutea]
MIKKSTPFVSIILVSYNSASYTIDCIESIRKETKDDSYEIIVVDNNSEPADRDRLLSISETDKVKLVSSCINLGFAGGNMLGVQQARPDSEYYFLLNNDTLFRNDVCGLLSAFLEINTQVGVCTPQTYKGDGSMDHSFAYFPSLGINVLGTAFMRLVEPNAYPDKKKEYTEPITVPVVTGSAMFIRGSVLRQLGGLDTTHFLYCEEEDFCLRVKRAGWQSALVPAAQFVHFAGGSGSQSWTVRREFYISLFHYFRKYHSPIERAALRVFYALKNARKVFRDREFGRLAWFILRGAPMAESLRYRQQIR